MLSTCIVHMNDVGPRVGGSNRSTCCRCPSRLIGLREVLKTKSDLGRSLHLMNDMAHSMGSHELQCGISTE